MEPGWASQAVDEEPEGPDRSRHRLMKGGATTSDRTVEENPRDGRFDRPELRPLEGRMTRLAWRSRIEMSAIGSVCVRLERCGCRRRSFDLGAGLGASRQSPRESVPVDSAKPNLGDGGGRPICEVCACVGLAAVNHASLQRVGIQGLVCTC
jgi:hypothetical protein